jgi:hypothetical protein
MRLGAAVVVALLGAPPLAVAQSPARSDGASPACTAGDGAWILRACFTAPHPAPVYDHSVLGDTPEWSALTVDFGAEGIRATGLPAATLKAGSDHIFEDIAPRLADLDGDGRPEVIAVHSSFDLGARLVAYAVTPAPRLLAATRHIGQRHRWLAPAGIGDFDGDGRVEIAYVDRPHLRKDLVLVRLEGDTLAETLRLPGLTNHRIGEAFISGGLRDCGAGAELVLASADWSRVMLVQDGQATDLGPMPRDGLTVPPC